MHGKEEEEIPKMVQALDIERRENRFDKGRHL